MMNFMNYHTHIGVYGLIVKSGNILLVHKARGPYKGKLDLPGGGIKSDEDEVSCLRREIKEETGVVVIGQTFMKNVEHTSQYITDDGEEETLTHIGKIYEVTDFDDTKFNNSIDGEDVSGAEWVDLRSIKLEQLSPFAVIAYNSAH